MKIQCSCGAKYSFDITPEMGQTPIRFVCQNCGLDSSDLVNELIRQELAAATPVDAPPPLMAAPTPAGAPPAGTSRMRIQASKAAAAADTAALEFCARHPGQPATHHCLVCEKPICRKCLELFGQVCSPLCKAKAEAQGMAIPEYKGKKSAVEAGQWRKVCLAAWAIGVVVAGLLGFWFWYAWFGSVPKPVFSIRFTEPAHSGESVLCGKDQLVFLHGDTLARCDLMATREIWSRQLIDRQQVADAAALELKEMRAEKIQLSARNPDAADRFKIPSLEELTRNVELAEEAALQLYVCGENVWVAAADKLVRYDWDTGKPGQEFSLGYGANRLIRRADELLLAGSAKTGQGVIAHFNLANGESRVETIGGQPGLVTAPGSARKSGVGAGTANSGGEGMAGLPQGAPGSDAGKPLDPAKVAEQVQRLSVPAKIALPVVLANDLHQEQIMAEVNDEPGARTPDATEPVPQPTERFSIIPSEYGCVEFSTRLLEARFIARNAMKAPPSKSALDGELTAAKTADVANETANEIQRSRGGDKVTEDESRCQVTVRRPDVKEAPEWTGEVIGPPSLCCLKTVNVVAGGKMLVVLDKMNKKLWQTTLTYNLGGGRGSFGEEAGPLGAGPCVERGDMLYVFDQAVLTAFDSKTGAVRWRLPSIGIVGMFFDDKGMMYLNTTTASPDTIKYSRQIDVTQTIRAIILKMDPRVGKILWSVDPGGFVSYVSGRFIYVVQSYDADDQKENPWSIGLEPKSHVWIRRLNPGNGRVMWEHYQDRAPLDVRFSGNTIQIVFKKEVQVLKFLSL
jgi:hypothetical protein